MTEIFPFLDMRGPEFLKLYVGSLIAATLLAILIRWLASFPFDYSDNNPPLNPYDISFLMGGKRRTMEAAIAALVHEEVLRIDTTDGYVQVAKGITHGVHPALRKLHEAVAAAGSNGLSYVKAIGVSPSGLFPEIEEKLEHYGLIVPWGRGMLVRMGTFALIATVGAMGAAKISIGLERNRPVDILILLTCIAVGIALVMLFKRPHRTVRGDRYVKDFSGRAEILRAAAATGAPGLGGADVAMVAGLYGVGILGGVLLSDLRTVHQRFVQPVSDGSSSSDSSSSCSSGSSCGGGGGGCGGCG